MSEQGAQSESGTVHYPPGVAPPTAAQRAAERAARLRDPEHLKKLNDARMAYYDKPLEQRRRERDEKTAAKAARAAEREARRAAKRGTVPPPTEPDSAPPTVRSARGTVAPAPAAVPPPSVPRGGFIGVPRGLLDLCAAMPNLGDGSCFIQVVRNKPTVSNGVPCEGVQRALRVPVDDHEFALEYGGSSYTLRGYEYRDDGRARPVTEPVIYKVPGAPNLDSMQEEETMPVPQRSQNPNGSAQFRRPGGVVTPQMATAEADIHSRELEHQEEMDRRERDANEARRQRQEQREQRERGENLGMAKLLAESKDKEAERLAEAHDKQLELLRERGGGTDAIVELLKVMKPGEDSAALSRQHTAEIRQLTEGHKSEMLRLTEGHREEITRLTQSHQATLQRVEDQARDDRKRADDLVRQAEQRSGDLVREAQTTADRRVSDAQNTARSQYDELRTRSEERVRDQNDSWQRRFDDLKELQARELRQKDSEITLMREGLQGNMTVILSGKDNEIKRLQHDVRAAKDEAEKNKDWVGKMKEMGETAEALGYVKASDAAPEGAEESTQTMALKAGFGVLQRLPETIQSISQAYTQIKNPGVPPELARAQARGGHPGMRTAPRTHGERPPLPPMQPLSFATEEGGYTPPPGLEPPRPRPLPGAFPVAQDITPVAQQPETAPVQQSVAPIAVPMQQQELPLGQPALPAPPQQTMAPPLSMAPPAPSAAPQPAQSGMPSELDAGVIAIIGQLAPELDRQFSLKTTPTEVAQALIAENGAELVKMALGVASIDQVIRYLSQNPGSYGALVSRNGQKYLREIWKSAGEAVGA